MNNLSFDLHSIYTFIKLIIYSNKFGTYILTEKEGFTTQKIMKYEFIMEKNPILHSISQMHVCIRQSILSEAMLSFKLAL